MVLLQLLRDAEVPQTDAIGIMLMLKEEEDTMWEMATWIYDNKPSDTEIMQWFGLFLKPRPYRKACREAWYQEAYCTLSLIG